MAVPSRNQTLFHCVFRLCYCVRSAVAQTSIRTQTCYVNAWIPDSSMQHVWAPLLTEVLHYSGNAIEIHNSSFYLGLPHACMRYKTVLVILYRAGAICRTLSKNWIASSIWRDDHEPVHMVSNCQNSSIMLSPCTCEEKLNARVVNHSCNKSNMNLRVHPLTTTLVAIGYTPKCMNRVQNRESII